MSPDTYQIVLTHQDFQGRHYYEYFGQPSNLRDRVRRRALVRHGGALHGQVGSGAFDPAYKMLPLAEFSR